MMDYQLLIIAGGAMLFLACLSGAIEEAKRDLPRLLVPFTYVLSAAATAGYFTLALVIAGVI